MTAFDLRSENWLHWIRRSGETFWGTPHDVVSGYLDDPVVAIATPRPDFDRALAEFLIGLLAVALRPADHDEWETLWEHPPSEDEFASALSNLPNAFSLDGDGARFLQDLSETDLAEGEEWSIETLLINSPGSSARDAARRTQVADLFVKEGTVTRMSRSTAAMALITMQTYAPEGGRGQLTSMRGGGPLTTLVEPVSFPETGESVLWRKLWANVETLEDLRTRHGGRLPTEPSTIFPWLAPTRTSERPRALTTPPSEGHPLQAYFGMPRRIRLEFDGPGECGISGESDSVTVSTFRMRHSGVKYDAWKHPLSPYYDDGGESRPVHGQPRGIGWGDWVGIAFSGSVSSGNTAAAATVTRFGRRLVDAGHSSRRFNVHAFGYDTKQNKARGWVDSSLPAYALADREKLALIYTSADSLTRAASSTVIGLVGAIKAARFERKDDQKKLDLGFASSELWSRTEQPFYDVLDLIAESDSELASLTEAVVAQKQAFHGLLRQHAFAIFDTCCSAATFEPAELKRRIAARHDLSATLAGYNKLGNEIFAALEIPAPVQAKKKRRSKQPITEAHV